VSRMVESSESGMSMDGLAAARSFDVSGMTTATKEKLNTILLLIVSISICACLKFATAAIHMSSR